jgi:phage terminase large subunit-like protein
MAFSDEEGDKNGSTYIAATSLEQSGNCFESAQLEMELAGHEGMKFSCSKNFKQTKMGTRKMVAVTSNPKDGRVFHCLIVEEFHEHDSRDLVDSILKGRIADPECLCFYVTTAGKNLFSPCKQEHDYAERVVRGILNDKAAERYFVAIFAPDKKDIGNIKEPDVWQKANPNWGVSVIPETFEVDYLKAVEMGKSAVNTFMTKNLDIWVMDNSRWADMPKWFACKKPIDQNELVEKKRQCFGGLDLSTISDFTAYTKDFYFDGIHHFVNRYYIPETETDNLSRRLKVPLYDWINAGYIIPTPGAVIDYAVIADDICQDRDTYNLRFVAGDPYHLKLLNVFMPDWWGDVGFEFSQGWRSISPCIISFEHDYKVGKVVCDDPVADWMMDCAEAKYSNDLVKLVKPDRGKSASRIDGVVTMVMAHDTAEVQGQAAQITKVSQLFSFM